MGGVNIHTNQFGRGNIATSMKVGILKCNLISLMLFSNGFFLSPNPKSNLKNNSNNEQDSKKDSITSSPTMSHSS